MKIVFRPEARKSNLDTYYTFYEELNHKAQDSDKDIILNKEFMFLDLISLGEKLQNTNKTLTLDLCFISSKLKLTIIQILSKYIYTFQKYKTSVVKNQVIIIKDKIENERLINDIVHKITITNFVRDLQNEPANLITPHTFCVFVKKYLKDHLKTHSPNSEWFFKIDVMDDVTLLRSGLNLIYEMGKASIHKSRFLIMNYGHKKAKKTFVIVGKGVTFDAGGMNLKTENYMDLEMKSDKSGGCIGVGIMKYIVSLQLQCNLTVLIPLIENLIDGDAIHPGDVVKSYNGKTVEIVDTDAEGRLIMADALAYSKHFNADYIFDVATLTGWTDLLHCHHVASYFTSNKKLYNLIYETGELIGEPVIGLPTWTGYRRFTKSQVADYKNFNFGCKKTGGFMAAMFLYNFVPKELQNKWVHFDISNSYTGSFSNGHSFLLILHVLLRLM